MSDRIVAGMAVLAERMLHFPDIWERIEPQVDELYVSVGENTPVHPLIKSEEDVVLARWKTRKDDARKFTPLWSDTTDFYFFSMDDDLLYPKDYVEQMTRFIRYYDNKIVSCAHGSWIEEFPCKSYYRSKKAVHFAQPLAKPQQVLFPGTGTTAFHTTAIAPREGQFPIRNIADVQMGLAAQAADIPVLSIPRDDKWIQQHPDINAMEDSIWANRRQHDSEETRLINDYAEKVGWEFPSLPPVSPEGQAE